MVLNVYVLKLFVKGPFVLLQMSWKIVSFTSLCVICFLGFFNGFLLCSPIGLCRNESVFYFIRFLGFLLGSYCAAQLVFVEMEGFFRLCLVTVFVFYFQKLVFENIKKKQFSCIFEIKNMFG